MAINRLRQQNLFDSFGGFNYMDDRAGGLDTQITSRPPLKSEPFPIPYSRLEDIGNAEINPDMAEYQRWRDLLGPGRQDEEEIDWDTALRQYYKPETGATERFNQLLDNPPERNKPSWMRKLVAGGQAVGNTRLKQSGGIEEAEKTMYAPYHRDLGEWKAKAEPYYQAANLERQGNINERQLASQVLVNQRENRRIAETERKNKATEENVRFRNQAYAFKQMHPDWAWDVKGTRILVKEPGTNHVMDLGPTGNLSEIDKAVLGIVKATEIARATEDIRQPGRIELKETVPGKNESPADAGKNRMLKLQEAYDTHPEWKELITKKGNNVYEIKERIPNNSWIPFAPPTPEQEANLAKLKEFVYGTKQPTPATKPAPTTPPTKPAPSTGRPPAAGRGTSYGQGQPVQKPPVPMVRVKELKTGRIGMMPADRVEAAIMSKRYQRVP